jgi:alkanesulfonate monooxygenase SsuD/methylene tetrahydromethanopterin reductase-like flavin-dependent oxidoreductase (luciferase family)
MWLQDTYEGFEGKYWSLPPRKVLPKPWGKGHPPMWYAAGNLSSWEMAAHKGLGILGFGVSSFKEAETAVQIYKKAIVEAEPVGAYVNDNVMVTTAIWLAEDAGEAVRQACRPELAYQNGLLWRYHDTFPRPASIPEWPELLPPANAETIPAMRDAGVIVGDPDDAIRAFREWEATGVDQIAVPMGPMTDREGTLEMIRLMGEYIIPVFDKDPIHRTTRFRETAA